MNNLANLYMKTGKLTQALEMYTQVAHEPSP